MRIIEQTTLYDGGWQDEWGPYAGPAVDTWNWKDADFTAFVRRFNRAAKLRGDGTRLRSIEVDEACAFQDRR